MEHSDNADEHAQLDVMLRSHVERCLQDVWEQPHLVTDDDNDYPYRWGTAACWVHVGTGSSPVVRVFAHAVHGVKKSARLLTELNDLNTRARLIRVLWDHHNVVVSADLSWTAIDRPTLHRTLVAVGSAADDIGTLVAAVHGGNTPFAANVESSSEDAA